MAFNRKKPQILSNTQTLTFQNLWNKTSQTHFMQKISSKHVKITASKQNKLTVINFASEILWKHASCSSRFTTTVRMNTTTSRLLKQFWIVKEIDRLLWFCRVFGANMSLVLWLSRKRWIMVSDGNLGPQSPFV